MTSLLTAGLSPGCVTGVGSLPFVDADLAVEFVAEFSPELPSGRSYPCAAGEGDRTRHGVADRVPRARRTAILLVGAQ